MDKMVLATQEWLNKTYGNDSRFNKLDLENKKIKGKTGWPTIYALTRALQIELGITNTADNFGPTTQKLFKTIKKQSYPSPGDNKNAIIQGALWCKGYSTGSDSITTNFYDGTESAIIKLKKDAGLTSPNGDVTLNVMKALLSMDAFVCIPSGTEKVRSIQQSLNRKYEDYIGLMPCDGVYGRNTNTALIYALQAEEGLSTSVANGYFGPSTKRNCPTIDQNTDLLVRAKFMPIIQSALICLGFDCKLTNQYDTQTLAQVRLFQKTYGIPVTNTINLTTWASLLTSCGDIERSAKACDCATILTPKKASTLVDKGYSVVGRYLTGYITDENGNDISKALTQSEIEIIFNAGLRFFPIYQTSANRATYFTINNGQKDAYAALEAAENLYIPENTIIYFAVDYDATENEMSEILNYFRAIRDVFISTSGRHYKIGIYATRNICTQVSMAGYATSSFVSDMSTGFSGNLGFSIPDNWAFDQFHTVTVGSGSGQIEIDKDAYSGRDIGVSRLQLPGIKEGIGDGIPMLNGSDIPLRVFRKKQKVGGGGYTIGVDEFDSIPKYGLFVYKENYAEDSERNPLPGSGSNLDGTFRVIFTNSAGNQCEGYINDGGVYYQGENYEEMAQAWKLRTSFQYYGVLFTNLSSYLITKNVPESINGSKILYYVFTLSDDSDYYNSKGIHMGTLNKGTKIAIQQEVCYTKSTSPWLIHVDLYCPYNGEWHNLCDSEGGFLDLRFDLGNLPSNRLLR